MEHGTLTTGQLVKQAQVNIETIRYYEPGSSNPIPKTTSSSP